MRKVKFKKAYTEEGYPHGGRFHQWAASYEEFESGAGNYTVAIIELSDGTIEEVIPSFVKFIDDEPFPT